MLKYVIIFSFLHSCEASRPEWRAAAGRSNGFNREKNLKTRIILTTRHAWCVRSKKYH